MKSGVICYLCSDPIRFLEGLLFVRKLYLSQNNPCQLALVHIDSPYEPSVRDAMARLLDTPFPTDSIEHRFGMTLGISYSNSVRRDPNRGPFTAIDALFSPSRTRTLYPSNSPIRPSRNFSLSQMAERHPSLATRNFRSISTGILGSVPRFTDNNVLRIR